MAYKTLVRRDSLCVYLKTGPFPLLALCRRDFEISARKRSEWEKKTNKKTTTREKITQAANLYEGIMRRTQ